MPITAMQQTVGILDGKQLMHTQYSSTVGIEEFIQLSIGDARWTDKTIRLLARQH